jgi:hypothetical protein
MKNLTQTIFRLLVLTGCIAFAACTDEDTPSSLPSAEVPAYLGIKVTDKGFTADEASTRSYEREDTTVFTQGDAIGILCVRNGAVVSDVNNIKATYDGSKWVTSSNIPYYSSATYIAYTPYNASLSTTGITSASGIVDSFDWPEEKQTYRAAYVACDLMTGTGSIQNDTLTFSLSHAFSMLEIVLPRLTYHFTSRKLPDYSVPLATFESGTGLSMYLDSPNLWRCIVKPGTAIQTTGRYTDANGKLRSYSYQLDEGVLKAGEKRRIQVDEEQIINFKPEQGDLFMADGRLVSKSDIKTQDTKDCIGVVFYVNSLTDRIGNQEWATLTGLGSKPHGYVMALKNATLPTGNIPTWSTQHSLIDGILVAETWQQCDDDVEGLQNTLLLNSANAGTSTTVSSAIQNYNDSVPPPSTATQWFLPSTGQWFDLLRKLTTVTWEEKYFNSKPWDDPMVYQADSLELSGSAGYVHVKLNNKMADIKGTEYDEFTGDNDIYWTSTECRETHARTIWFQGGYASSDKKHYYSKAAIVYEGKVSGAHRKVRCILAF